VDSDRDYIKNMANEKFEKLISEIEKLTALELAELVKALEEKFGISAAAPASAQATAGRTSDEIVCSYDLTN